MEASVATLSLMALILVLAIPLLAIAAPVLIVLAIIRALSGSSGKRRQAEVEETRIMQDIHHGLSEMEKRITNLETIILERARKTHHAERP